MSETKSVSTKNRLVSLTVHGDEIGGLGGFTDLDEYLQMLWLAMNAYGYVTKTTIENGV